MDTITERGDPSGLPVIFLHGFPFSQEMWQGQLEAIPPEFRAIAYDLRGLGRSERGDGQYTIEGHVDDLIALMDRLSIPGAILVGLSMGGYIALRALERNPERILGAVLCDTRSEADTDEVKLRRAAQIKDVKTRGSDSFAEGFLSAIFSEDTFSKNPEAVAKIRDIIGKTPPLSIAGTLLALAARSDTTRSLGKIKVPTLILVGEKDGVTPPETARAMQAKIPGSRLEILPGAGHMSNLENPELFNRLLLDFLRSFPNR